MDKLNRRVFILVFKEKVFGSFRWGDGRGSGEAQVASDFGFKKRCPCPSLLRFYDMEEERQKQCLSTVKLENKKGKLFLKKHENSHFGGHAWTQSCP